MQAIEFSQQQLVSEVISSHIRTAAIYCFGTQTTAYSSSRLLGPDKGVQKEHVHLYLLVFVRETIENANNDISDKISTRTGGRVATTLLLHPIRGLKKLCHDQQLFFWQVMQEAELWYQDKDKPPYLNNAGIPKRNVKSTASYVASRSYVSDTIWDWVYNDDNPSGAYRVKMASLHQIVEQTCLSLIRVFMGYTPNHFALGYLFGLCEYFTTITADFFPRQTKEEKALFNLLKQQPNGLRFSRANYISYLQYDLLEERCGAFKRQADLLIQNEMDRLSEAEKETKEISS